MKRLTRGFAVAGLLAMLGGALFADNVELKNGKQVSGEVLEDVDGRPLVFRHKVGESWKTTEVERDKILRYTREAGDQSDETDGSSNSDRPDDGSGNALAIDSIIGPSRIETIEDISRIIEDVISPKQQGQEEVVLLKLNGPFEQANVHKIGAIISHADFLAMLSVAESRGPAAIVLEIDSPGGLASEMDRIIDTIIETQSKHRLVAWVNLGGSAAALSALACKEIVMMPNGRMGAATAVVGSGEAAPAPRSALEQKNEAMRDARRRQISALTGRSPLLQQAMEFPELRLWHHSDEGFSTNAQFLEDWVCLDNDPNRPLVMTADEAVAYGVADSLAGNKSELLQALKLHGNSKIVEIDLSEAAIQSMLANVRSDSIREQQEFEKARDAYKKKVVRLLDNISAAASLNSTISGTDRPHYTPAELASLKLAIGRCRIPTMTDDLRRAFAKRSENQLKLHDKEMDLARRRIAAAMRKCRMITDLPCDEIHEDLWHASEHVLQGVNTKKKPKPSE
jgi:ATP-dependent protease ClpP protease subunit